jgi:uncharacterized membrane protein YecN with MAPEG domain
MAKCNFMKNMGFAILIVMELTNAEQYYVQISYISFHHNRMMNVASMNKNSYTPPNEMWLPLSQIL